MSIYVNRILNLKRIKAIGLDMDHTVVSYHTENFELLTFNELVKKLIEQKKYPKEINKIKFEFKRAIRGLVIDKKNGNLVKLSLYGRVKLAYHGHQQLNFREMNRFYRGMVIDLNDPDYSCVDTTFSLGEAILFSGLVEMKEKKLKEKLPSYEEMAHDVHEVLDLSHKDDSLKGVVVKDLEKYIVRDPKVPQALENFKRVGKILMIITNSDFHYTKTLLDYTFNPYLKHYKNWMDLFDYVITCAEKPAFFGQKRRFLKVNPNDGTMTNYDGPLEKGIYQGGHALAIQNSFDLVGEEILYVGDHIYGDILQLKKVCNWRTGLVFEEIEGEVNTFKKAQTLIEKIDSLMQEKEVLEQEFRALQWELGEGKEYEEKFKEMKELDEKLSHHIEEYQKKFNPFWGEVSRAGAEESRYMGQVSKYACIYMGKIAEFKNIYPNHYFRPRRRPLPHER